ncbi:MAG TPA: APC family permease [Micromonosporaceae bacterium]
MAVPVGLARKSLGGGALFFFSVGASAPMTVVAGGMVATYASTGVVGVPAAFPVLTAALTLFSVGYVAMARHVPHAGPFYAHVARGLGPGRGLAAAPLALLAYNAIQICLYGLLGVVVAGLLGGVWWHWALAAWVAVALLGVLHVAVNARLLALLLVCEIAVVLLFDAAAFAHPAGGSVSVTPLLPASLAENGVGGVFALSVAAFVGFESALAYGEEARSHTAVARATFGSLLFIGLLYAASSWAMAVAVGPDRVVEVARDPSAGIPMSTLNQHYGGLVAVLASLLLVSSIFAAMLSFHHTSARYVFVLSRERVLPSALGRIGRGTRAGAPIGGSLLQTAIAFLVIVASVLTGADPLAVLFTQLSAVAAIGVMVLMVAASLAALRFYRRGGGTNESSWVRVGAPTLALVAVGLILAVTVLNLDSMLGTAPGSPAVLILPGLVAGAGLGGLVWAWVVRRRRPATFRNVGLGEPEPLAELEHHLAAVDV